MSARKRARERHYDSPIHEVRPGIVRKTFELPTELYLSMKMAAKARGVYTATLWRAAAIKMLSEITVMPAEGRNPSSMSLALSAAYSLKDGNEAVTRVIGKRDPVVEKALGLGFPGGEE